MRRLRTGQAELCQTFADEQWLAAHVEADHATETVRDQFKRAVLAEIALLSIETERGH